MVCICTIVCDICCAYFYTGEDRYRWSKLKSCNSDQNGGICKDGCPVNAIGDDFKVNPEICIACFRCIRNCPVGAKNMETDVYRTFAKEFSEKLSARRENEFFL